MTHEVLAARVAEDLPRRLSVLRGENTLQERAPRLGVEEVTCPACGGTGWLNRRSLWRCPLCYCMREVPLAVSEWFQAEMRRRRSSADSGPPGDRPAGRTDSRPGRTAEDVHAVHCRVPSAQS
jgi:hypothetical protein